ncbi:MAG: GNAT family N-acetyltransferase [candidate division Zixibacteria bacterium]|nr:GNAT family N-acetyltransferase [candidate division Zixibacteria bacterium]
MFTVMHINHPDFTDQYWRSYYDMFVELRNRYGAMFSSVTWEELRDRQLSFIKKEDCCSSMVLLDGDDVVGWMQFIISHRGTTNENAHIFTELVDADVPPAIVTTMANELARLMDKYGCSKTHTMAELEHMCDVFRQFGAEQLCKLDTFKLHRDNVNRSVIEDWLDTIPQQNADLKLEFFDEPPDRYIENLAQLLTDTLREMPEEHDTGTPFHVSTDDIRRQTQWRKENNSAAPKVLLVDNDNKLVGISNVFLSLTNPREVYQAMTGVRSDYRRRGLAKWLKAAMFTEMERRYPKFEKLTTNMRAVNEPIRRINAQMGYKLVHEGFEFTLRREHLEQYLSKSV